MPNTLKDQWQPYARLVPFEAIATRLELPRSQLNEDVRFILPSISLAKDGPVVKSLLLVTERYICEVRLNQNISDFDVALLAMIRNYRVGIGTKQIAREEAASSNDPHTPKQVTNVTYETAEVSLRHSATMATNLTYVGDVCKDRDAWVRHVFSALPLDLLVKSRGHA